MPKNNPTMSYTLLRNYTEQFQWTDPATRMLRKGFNPPADAIDVARVPFFIRYVTSSGKMEGGVVTCIAVDAKKQQRKIKYVDSGEIRIVYDYLIIEIDGTRFVSH